ncbi:MAG: NAD(P)H-dependent glycerol-3-phosphate dehydrogenase [Caloramator sp.]|jgi:glycerol-3-phosphate dehydrogenase (NAD(P)+)|uniref:NAD(P)H-dependent glycerol-3-phosphate dehydrogenase n=1 Tax=Caloramator sp. TaxID=1871330 RepID=UPI001DF87384|nr:NAD(P)H-dependent glycerol-3-phosphate dehydrogenase [Caloramator sp.]MBZ4664052.1 NAD(P)H-dependent glycerol-3-phosphate dehydrogenase [Caloramator sp.]
MKVGILGAGSWGSAIAIHLAKKGYSVEVWDKNKDLLKEINNNHTNTKYLKKVEIPDGVKGVLELSECIKDKEIIVFAVPSHALRIVCKQASSFLTEGQIIVSLVKGLENTTYKRMSEIIKEECPNNEVVVLSGPTHAEEVSVGIPTTIVAASENIESALYIQDIFMDSNFRVYTNTDVVGVEIGAAVKNIVALAAGISDGLGYGDNTKAALMTRGIAEITRLGVKLGANPMTFAGLAGIGDLIVTCTSMHSRNRRCGILLGQGMDLKSAMDSIGMVVEGVHATEAVYNLAKNVGVEMPIVNALYDVLFNNRNPREAVNELMTRDKKSELEIMI